MILNCYAIFDSKAGVYSHPIFCQSDGVAKRQFIDAVAEPKHAFALHPEDYSLCRVGNYDDVTGRFASTGHVEVLLNGLQARSILVAGSGSYTDESGVVTSTIDYSGKSDSPSQQVVERENPHLFIVKDASDA